MPGRSDVIRNHAERAVLELLNARMAAVSLSGYIFFGSSVSISDKVQPPASYPQASYQHPSLSPIMLVAAATVRGPCPTGNCGSIGMVRQTWAALSGSRWASKQPLA